jgi:hypothetical protein
VRRSLSDDSSHDIRSADRAGLAGSLVDTKVVLELASPVNPIQACSIMPQPLSQRTSNPAPQPSRLLGGEGVAPAEGVELGSV